MPMRSPLLPALVAVTLGAVGPTTDAGPATAQEAKKPPSFRDQRRWSPGVPSESGPATPGEARAAPTPTPAVEPRGPATAPAGESAARGAGDIRPPAEAKQSAVSGCGQAGVTTAALPAGRMRLSIETACRAGQELVWSYGGAEHEARLDAQGRGEIVVDCFAGTTTPVMLRFADNATVTVPVTTRDLDTVSKVALVWRAAVNLDLHAYEYAAKRGEPGHVWGGAPSSYALAEEHRTAERRGVGFLSSESRGEARLDKLEVYTFLHREGQAHGVVATAVDFASRGGTAEPPHCGTDAAAEIAFRIVALARGKVSHEHGLLAGAPCGTTIAEAVRSGDGQAMPLIRARR